VVKLNFPRKSPNRGIGGIGKNSDTAGEEEKKNEGDFGGKKRNWVA